MSCDAGTGSREDVPATEPGMSYRPPMKLPPWRPARQPRDRPAHATPSHNLVFRGGRRSPRITFSNFYIWGRRRLSKSYARSKIDDNLAKAMSDPFSMSSCPIFQRPDNAHVGGQSQVFGWYATTPFSKGDVEALVSNPVHKPIHCSAFDLPHGLISCCPWPELTTDDAPAACSQRPTREEPHTRTNRVADADDKAELARISGVAITVGSSAERIYYAIVVFSDSETTPRRNGICRVRSTCKNACDHVHETTRPPPIPT